MKTLSLAAALLCAASFAFASESMARIAGEPAAVDTRRDEFPEDWFWRQGSVGAAHRAMVGKPPPPIAVTRWTGDDAATPDAAARKE